MSLQKHFIKSKHACKVTFSLPKEATNGFKDVKILGDFNNWEKELAIPMKAENGGFKASLELNPGREYEFRYLINDETWENDWDADKYSMTPYGVENSVVVIPDEFEQ
jgi:1,4-alpha-glucan branching enzyme